MRRFTLKTIKVGVIGAGGISHAHVGGYQKVEGVEVVAVADVVPGKAQQWAERYGVKHHFTDYKRLLAMEEIDAVSVCTFNRAHKQPTVDALKAGKHVLCEKPMSDTLKDAAAMLKAAQQTGKILMIGLHSRYSPSQRLAQHIIQEGTLGDIYYGEIVGTRRRGIPGGTFVEKDMAGGGAVVDIGVYSLDTALCLMGHPKPVSVTALTSNYIATHCPPPPFANVWRYDPKKVSVEDFGAAFIRFENGAVLLFKISWAVHADSLGRSFFLGTKAGLALGPLEIFRDEFGTMVNITPKEIRDDVDRFREETADFVRAVREGRPSPIPPEEVIWTNVVMDGIYRSAKAGREVKVGLPQ